MATRGRNIAFLALFGAMIGVMVGGLALLHTQAYSNGFSGSDEPAHFLNAYLVSVYFQHWLGSNPMAVAADFYVHYPKITIGHWPPAYYALLGLVFTVIPATVKTAFIINLLVSALPSAGVAVALGSLAGWRAGVIGAVIYAFTPLAIEGQTYFMLDQALAACCIAAAMSWYGFVKRPGWPRAFVFSAFCMLAVLLKGNGWLVVFLPLYYMILTRSFRLLALPYLYGAALVAAIVVVPWYWVTAGISADGFNYKAGLAYATTALFSNLSSLVSNLGMASLPLVGIAVFLEYRGRRLAPMRWEVISVCLSLVLATLTLQSLIPVDIVDRYLAPALPAVLVLAMIGIIDFRGKFSKKTSSLVGGIVAVALACSLASPGVLHLIDRQPKPDYRMDMAAEAQKVYSMPGISLIDGTPNAEGAYIAEMAIRDPLLNSYSIRASKLLAESNFMGSNYILKFQDSRNVARELDRMGIRTVVITRMRGQLAFPHSMQLVKALDAPGSRFHKVATFTHKNIDGTTEVYMSSSEVVPNFSAAKREGAPAKAAAMIDKM